MYLNIFLLGFKLFPNFSLLQTMLPFDILVPITLDLWVAAFLGDFWGSLVLLDVAKLLSQMGYIHIAISIHVIP